MRITEGCGYFICTYIYIYCAYITAKTGQSITSLLNLTDLIAGRNGAAARKKVVIKSSKDASSPVPWLLGQD